MPQNITSIINKNKRYYSLTHNIDGDFDFRSIWSRLQGGAFGTPFQSPCFLEAFYNTIVPHVGSTFSICEVRDSETSSTVALIPFTVTRRGPVRIASLPDFGLADQTAPVFAQDFPVSEADFPDIWQAFTENLQDADLIDIDKIPSHIGPRTNPLFQNSFCEPSGGMYYLDLSGNRGWMSKKVFKNIRQKERKLSEAGVEFVQTQDPRGCLELFDELREQRRRRFDLAGRPNSLECRPGFADFYRRLASNAAPEGAVTTFCLRTGDEIISSYLALANDAVFNGVLISIGSEEWHRYSPGMVLTKKLIDWCAERGVRTFSFGTGHQEYKRRFGGSLMNMRRIVQPLTGMGKAYLMVRQLHKIAQKNLGPNIKGLPMDDLRPDAI
jgi:CelD/BcsL family acetyltransferase involved in cellulose biosynthesis